MCKGMMAARRLCGGIESVKASVSDRGARRNKRTSEEFPRSHKKNSKNEDSDRVNSF